MLFLLLINNFHNILTERHLMHDFLLKIKKQSVPILLFFDVYFQLFYVSLFDI